MKKGDMLTKCYKCKVKMKEVDTIVTIKGKAFPAHAEKCPKCGEEVFKGEEVEKIRKLAMKKGLWKDGVRMTRKLQKIGRATALYIPADIRKQLKLRPRQKVVISIEDHKMVVEPIK